MANRHSTRAQLPGGLHVAMGDALRNNETLGSLLQRLQQSRQRMACITPLLPAALSSTVQPGPLDEKAWTLLVTHAAGAAKLRQMLPQLQAELLAQGWPDLPIKLRVQGQGKVQGLVPGQPPQ